METPENSGFQSLGRNENDYEIDSISNLHFALPGILNIQSGTSAIVPDTSSETTNLQDVDARDNARVSGRVDSGSHFVPKIMIANTMSLVP